MSKKLHEVKGVCTPKGCRPPELSVRQRAAFRKIAENLKKVATKIWLRNSPPLS